MIGIKSLNGYTPSEESLKRAGVALVNVALTDADFERRWVAESCTENLGLTQREILNKLREDVVVDFRAYRKWWSKVIGYFVSGTILWDNLKFLDQFDSVESGSNDFHEVAHMKGFSHYFDWSTSVPYTLNRVFEAWAYARRTQETTAAVVGATPPVSVL